MLCFENCLQRRKLNFINDDYVSFRFGKEWRLGKIVSNNVEELTAEISLLKPEDTENYYKFYHPFTILDVPLIGILCEVKVCERKNNGFFYIRKNENSKIQKKCIKRYIVCQKMIYLNIQLRFYTILIGKNNSDSNKEILKLFLFVLLIFLVYCINLL